MADAPVPPFAHFSPEEREDIARRFAAVRLAQLTGWRLGRFGLSPGRLPADIGFVADMDVLSDNSIRLHFEVCGPADRLQAGVDAVQAEAARLAALGVVHGGQVP